MQTYRPGRLAIAVLAALGLGACSSAYQPPSAASGSGTPHWVSSWGTSQMPYGQAEAMPAAFWKDGTVRQIVRLSLGGSQVRVRISNAYGSDMLIVNEANIAHAVRPGTSELVAGSLQPLRFNGSTSVRIPAGAEYVSDPIDLAATRGLDVAISMHLANAAGQQTGHAGSRTTTFLAPGRQTGAASLLDAKTVTRWHQLADVEVSAAPAARAVVVIGDSITDGFGATTDANNRWTDHLVQRIAQDGRRPLAVINAGIGGGRLLREGLGPSLVTRFERDVLARNGVSHAVVFIGVNDIGVLRRSKEDTPQAIAAMLEDLKQAHLQMIARAHAKGICVIGATITPFMGSGYYAPAQHNEALRQAVNDWMRSEKAFDGVLDFDGVLRDPARPSYLAKAYDSGDGLHPSHAGYAALAAAVPLQQFDSCAYSRPR
ncbi:SGNH/GDSL hydrolase family protein [Massilia oculi]|uniref:GDSL family lipase n=1 Tax=Massilia oculi TaxID=945844 RepID=A0A2S2DNI5_9BURK|nr:SGNH/GDSL hydrolase family protein [Massilia oculi]AWL06914.1 GDSL family lipase [Massilia oculi]